MHITFKQCAGIIELERFAPAVDWCEEKFGKCTFIFEDSPTEWEGLRKWTLGLARTHVSFAFKNDWDYTMFVLRWGSEF